MIGMSDCLWGLLDGMNDAGLAVSLTFGGRRVLGDGFGIPLVVRYVLETCEDVAAGARRRSPVSRTRSSHNLTRGGPSRRVLTAYLSPDREPIFREFPAATNHQGIVEWPEQARATRTIERERCIVDLLDEPGMTADGFVDAFLRAPLFSTAYASGFGTLYTAAYRPAEGVVDFRWPAFSWRLGFDAFEEARAHRGAGRGLGRLRKRRSRMVLQPVPRAMLLRTSEREGSHGRATRDEGFAGADDPGDRRAAPCCSIGSFLTWATVSIDVDEVRSGARGRSGAAPGRRRRDVRSRSRGMQDGWRREVHADRRDRRADRVRGRPAESRRTSARSMGGPDGRGGRDRRRRRALRPEQGQRREGRGARTVRPPVAGCRHRPGQCWTASSRSSPGSASSSALWAGSSPWSPASWR